MTPQTHGRFVPHLLGQWPPWAVRRFLIYDVLLHEIGHLQVVDPKASRLKRKFASETRAQEFADELRRTLYSALSIVGWVLAWHLAGCDPDLVEHRRAVAQKGGAIESQHEIAGVAKRSRTWTVVGDVAELLEDPPRCDVLRHDGGVQAIEHQRSERKRVDHQREPRPEPFALRARRGDQERELARTVGDCPEVAIAGEHAVAHQQEPMRAGFAEDRVVLLHVGSGEGRGMPEQACVVRIVIGRRERGRVGADLAVIGLERDQLAGGRRPGEAVCGHVARSLPGLRYALSVSRALVLILAASVMGAACGSREPSQRTREGTYEGRTIAPACSHLGAAWLDRPEREAREQPERVVDALKLVPGMTVADVGAGTGYFTVRLARRVGPTGRVIATEIQPDMLRTIDARLGRERITNVELVPATASAAALPARCCDLVLLVDVYHELADPPAILAGIRRALKPTGRLVLVEYRGEDPRVPINPEHRMTLAQIKKELEPSGFRFVDSLEFLPDQRIVIFTRDDAM